MNPQLLAALADVGVEPADYALIEQARELVDEVNERLRARGSRMIYMITFCAPVPVPQHDVGAPVLGVPALGERPAG
jgi:hypothetical protein